MTTQEQILRLQDARNKIRTKATELGISTGTAKLDELATAIEGIQDNGAVSANVEEGETYTIPKGYHNGSGTVSGVAGGGNYTLQSKAATPTKMQQNITPDEGYYGLSDVTVAAIPEQFQDVSSVTATASDVLATKVFVTSDGRSTAGTMFNNGAINKTLDTSTILYEVPAGYHNGEGTVKVVPETKSATPTKETQTISATPGKVISSVTVDPIPEAYQDVTGVTATAATVLTGSKFVDAEGTLTDGTMPNNGAVTESLTVETTSYTVPAGYHDGSGTVSITTETKSATPTKSEQTIEPTEGSVLSAVTVAAIPAEYQDVTGVTATADKVLTGSQFVDSLGALTAGTMVDNAAVTATIDGLSVTAYTVPVGYHNGSGTVTLTSDIEDALAAI